MKSFRRIFASKEVKAVLGVLDEADQRFTADQRLNCRSPVCVFEKVKNLIEQTVFSNPGVVANKIRNGLSARQFIYSLIANISGDLLESGQFHVYRGVLNPLTGGEDLLRIFNAAVDEMVQMGAVDADRAALQKSGLWDNIKSVG